MTPIKLTALTASQVKALELGRESYGVPVATTSTTARFPHNRDPQAMAIFLEGVKAKMADDAGTGRGFPCQALSSVIRKLKAQA